MTKPATKEPPMTVLERLKELEAKATKGQCELQDWGDQVSVIVGDSQGDPTAYTVATAVVYSSATKADMALFAEMRNALPHLIAATEAVKSAVDGDGLVHLSPEQHTALAALTKEAPDAG